MGSKQKLAEILYSSKGKMSLVARDEINTRAEN
jgi:hypothetical protein